MNEIIDYKGSRFRIDFDTCPENVQVYNVDLVGGEDIAVDIDELEVYLHKQKHHDIMNDSRTGYRIQNSDKTILNAGTDQPSWFSLDGAREVVNYEIGQTLVESDGVNILWEVL